jgi:hypothetical protein
MFMKHEYMVVFFTEVPSHSSIGFAWIDFRTVAYVGVIVQYWASVTVHIKY